VNSSNRVLPVCQYGGATGFELDAEEEAPRRTEGGGGGVFGIDPPAKGKLSFSKKRAEIKETH
jgi:hypothetical protein